MICALHGVRRRLPELAATPSSLGMLFPVALGRAIDGDEVGLRIKARRIRWRLCFDLMQRLAAPMIGGFNPAFLLALVV